jgi:hypothetical protein
MPRRKRQSVRREWNGLDVAVAYSGAQAFGCSGVMPDHADLEALFDVFLKVGAEEGSWAHEAFVVGSPRPCETMVQREDPFGQPVEPVECGAACLFRWSDDD